MSNFPITNETRSDERARVSFKMASAVLCGVGAYAAAAALVYASLPISVPLLLIAKSAGIGAVMGGAYSLITRRSGVIAGSAIGAAAAVNPIATFAGLLGYAAGGRVGEAVASVPQRIRSVTANRHTL